MAESKSDHFFFQIKAHSEKITKFGLFGINWLSPFSECPRQKCDPQQSTNIWAEARLLRNMTMPFQKGKSGNPGGRPNVVGEVQTLARKYAPEAIETLRGIMENIDAPPAARISAAIALLDRGFGRPHQTSEVRTVQKPVSEMSDEELIARIRELEEDGGTPSH
jgi:hypothetical protein